MSAKTIVIRADASAEMGIGHVMRCLALGHAWLNYGGEVVFAIASGAEQLEERIRSERAEVSRVEAARGSPEDAHRTLAIIDRYQAGWLVVDGYHFSREYLKTLHTAKSRLLVVADDAEVPIGDSDIVVDPDLNGERAYTDLGRDAELLRGPEYALLRKEFLECARQPKGIPKIARRILITFGGGDSPNASLLVLQALEDISEFDLDVSVVVGPSNSHGQGLKAAASQSRHAVKVLEHVENMAEIMSHVDIAITGGGGTCYELAIMHVAMILITIAKNQEEPARAFASAGAAVAAGPIETQSRQKLSILLANVFRDHGLRKALVDRAGRMVDGKGAERIVQRMLSQSWTRQKERRG